MNNDYNDLREACLMGDVEEVKYLIAKGIDLHTDDDFVFRTACGNGHLEIVKLLLEHGVDIHAKDDFALIWAREEGHDEVVEYLNKRMLLEKLEEI
jgi:ankyrin repeat protein